MAETIRGINVVIGADTTALTSALADVNQRSKDATTELKQVERLLRMDPGNTQLIAQQQQLLGDAINATRDKLERLRAAQAEVERQFASGEINDGQYRAFQRAIIQTEQEVAQFQDRLQRTIPEIEEVGNQVGRSAEQMKVAGEKLSEAGKKMSVGITAPITGLFYLATEGTEELRNFNARLETSARAAGESMETVDKAMRRLAAVNDDVGSSAEAVSNILSTGFRGDAFLQVMDQLTGAAIKFSDTLKIEGLADGLQETLATGSAAGAFAELLERSGVSLDKFNAGLTDASKNGTETQHVMQQLSALGLEKVNEDFQKNNKALVENKEANYDLQKELKDLGDTLLPILTAINGLLAELLNGFNNLDPGMQKFIVALGLIAAAVGPVLLVIGQLLTGLALIMGPEAGLAGVGLLVSDLIAVFAEMGAALLAALGPIALIVAALAAVAAAIYLIVDNWDAISEFFRKLGQGIKDQFNNIIDWFQSLPARTVKLGEDLVRGLWEGIQRTISWLGDKIAGFVRKVLDFFHLGFLIKSPSRVMRDQVGKYVGQGFALGIEDTLGDTEAAIQQVKAAVIGGLSGLGSINVAASVSGGAGVAGAAAVGGSAPQNITVQVSADSLQSMTDVVTLFENLRQTQRARG